jgi:Na+-transporting methylmalonyl-CoA/oxaloacetate decarboxylase gamma subunit
MNQAIGIFIVGFGGVFIGMALLYIAIRIVALVVDRIGAGKEA